MATFLLSAFADEASEMLDGQIAALKRNDLHCIEPRNINGGPTLRKTDEELFAIRKQLDDAGITVPSFGSPIGKWKITDDFEPQLADFRRALRVCEILGTKRMRMFSYYLDRTQMKEYREEILRRLSVMLEEGERAGIKLCHENEGEIYGQNPEDVADILTSLPGLHAVYDPANFVFCRQDPIKGLDVSIGSMEYMEDLHPDADEIDIPTVHMPPVLKPYEKNIKQEYYDMDYIMFREMLLNQNTNECRSTYYPHEAWTVYKPDQFKTGLIKDMKKVKEVRAQLKGFDQISHFTPAMYDYRNLLNFWILDNLDKRGMLKPNHKSKM